MTAQPNLNSLELNHKAIQGDKGRVFYSCENYPECEFSSWKRPLLIPCPSCGGLLVAANKNQAKCIICSLEFKLDDLQKELG